MRVKLTILLWVLGSVALGQIQERPLPLKSNNKPNSVPFATQQGQAVLTLPFWDDFSTSGLIPDSDKWVNSENVRISNGIGKNAPSLNVAVFDGVTASGSPYNATSLINGATDSLISQVIDLSNLPIEQRDSVYLSFFWQINGNGELPDSEDSLVLQFKEPSGVWQSVWNQTGGVDNESEEFQQVLVKVERALFHNEFQFRFRSYSRLAGPFDTWLVDYIYLNDSRHANDIAYLDRSLTRKPSFLTAPYAAMPTEQFFAYPGKYLVDTDAEFLNLNSFFQPVQFSTIVRDVVNDVELERMNDDQVANPLPGAFERRSFTSDPLSANNIDRGADSLLLETSYFINSGDNFFIESINPGVDTVFSTNIDYRINDTVKVVTVIDDYFAYDDGDPDFAAGINQAGGQLAYQYFAETNALLTHVDINFPFVQQTGEPISIFVWSKLDNDPQSILFQDPYSVLRPDEIGDLRAYRLDTPIFVQDTFYIGFQQATNEFLAVGLDKNQDSGDKMFFNVSGEWRPNETVNGSFLMRPRFDKEIAVNFVPAGEAAPSEVKVYPNPSNGEFYIAGEVAELKIFDNWAQAKTIRVREERNGVWVDLSSNKKGIYLLKFLRQGKVVTKRVILNE